MKIYKSVLCLMGLVAMLSCNQKQEIDSIGNESNQTSFATNVNNNLPKFSNKDMQRYVEEYDALMNAYIQISKSDAYATPQGQRDLEQAREDLARYKDKMNILVEEEEPKEKLKLLDYMSSTDAQMSKEVNGSIR